MGEEGVQDKRETPALVTDTVRATPIRVNETPCTAGWAGCTDNYTGGHYCEQQDGHDGPHRCVCGTRRVNHG